MSCVGNKIAFNQVYYGEGNTFTDVCDRASQIGAWVKNASPQTIGAHEAGHGVEWLLIQSNPAYTYDSERVFAWNSCSEAKGIVDEAVHNIKKTEYGKGKKKDELIRAISQYALDSYSETLAEAFHDVYANGEDADLLSAEIKKITMERLKQYKGR